MKLRAIIFGLLVIGNQATTGLEEAQLKLAVLTAVNAIKSIRSDEVFQALHASHPRITFEEVDNVLRNIAGMAAVPRVLHETIVESFPHGELDAWDMGIAHLLSSNPIVSARYASLQALSDSVAVWITFCINQSRREPREEWCNENQDFWFLTPRGMGRYVEWLIEVQTRTIESVNSGTVTPVLQSIPAKVARLLVHNFDIPIEEIGTQLGISAQVARVARNSLLRDFVQPQWFLEILIGYEGLAPIDPHDPVLVDAVLTRNASLEPLKVEGDVFKAIELWVNMAINPLRALQTDVPAYSVTPGRLAVMLPETIQQYLATVFL